MKKSQFLFALRGAAVLHRRRYENGSVDMASVRKDVRAETGLPPPQDDDDDINRAILAIMHDVRGDFGTSTIDVLASVEAAWEQYEEFLRASRAVANWLKASKD